MSDLEPSGSSQRAPLAVQNLTSNRIAGATGRRFGIENRGEALDAFAEVFASMAAATVAPQRDPAQRQSDSSPAIEPRGETGDSADDARPQSLDQSNASGADRTGRGDTNEDRSQPRQEADNQRPTHRDDNADYDANGLDRGQEESDTTVPDSLVSVATGPADTTMDETAGHQSSRRHHRDRSQSVAEAVDSSLPTSDTDRRVDGTDEPTGEPSQQVSEAGDSNGEEDVLQQHGGRSHHRSGRHAAERSTASADASPRDQAEGNRAESAAAESAASKSDRRLQAESNVADAIQQHSAASRAETAANAVATAASTGRANQSTPATHSMNRQVGSQMVNRVDLATPSAAGDRSSKSAAAASQRGSEAVSRAKLIQRVSKAFHHLSREGGVVRLRLAPADLGTVRIEMRIEGRNMNARVVAETDAATKMLREHLPDLRSRLESFGMQIESIEIETESESGNFDRQGWFDREGQGDQSNHRQQRPRWSARSGHETVSREVSSAASLPEQISQIASSPGQVDLRL